MDGKELPLGFGFALAQNPEAMKKFANLPEPQQAEILQRAHAASSKDEMQMIVNDFSAHG